MISSRRPRGHVTFQDGCRHGRAPHGSWLTLGIAPLHSGSIFLGFKPIAVALHVLFDFNKRQEPLCLILVFYYIGPIAHCVIKYPKGTHGLGARAPDPVHGLLARLKDL